ncbi:hypothetical protein OKW96_01740 [Sphingobacterium sp. KU25419]|nr:hypothetical protein OKW96_01740 [Sphingobacterium sp. KU25419]
MKRIYSKISILLVAASLSASCSKVLDAPTKSSLDESIIFSTPSLASGAIAGIIQSFGETNSYRVGIWCSMVSIQIQK